MSTSRKSIITSLRLAGGVMRYHTWPTLQKQTVAEHTWNVMRIYAHIWGPPERDVAYTILMHDVAEIATGDIPFPVKARNPELKAICNKLELDAMENMGIILPYISEIEEHRVKIADLLEMHEFGCQEYLMGNKYALPIAVDTAAMAEKISHRPMVMDIEQRSRMMHLINREVIDDAEE